MRIVIDVQGAQTESRTRGIGRYTLSFVDALVRHRGNHDIILALNGLFPETIEPIRAHFRDMLPRENIRVWYAPGPVRAVEPDNDGRRQAAELIREAFLASLDPDIVHVTSLFEGFTDDAVTSIGAMAPRMSTSVTIYDLIPLRNPDDFLKPNPSLEKWYRRKLDYLKKADLHLAISEATARDARDALSLADDRVVTISTACSEMFRQRAVPEVEKQGLFSKFGLGDAFILCSGTIEPHKNLSRLFHAYARLPRALREAYQLLLVGKADETQKLLLNNMARDAGIEDGRLIVSGYVSDDDLVALYNLCAVTVVFSYPEEFGLPALEAMSCGGAVIGSNTTSIPEVIGSEEALFDPYHEASITAKLAQALTDDPFCAALKAHGLKQARKFSWDETAKRALTAMERAITRRQKRDTPTVPQRPRLKLAYVSPLPPERTGIADYSAELIPVLAEHYEIIAVVDQEKVSDSWVKTHCDIRDANWLRANATRIDRVLYHMGNSPFHNYMRSLVTEIPGTIVLHDFFLSGLLCYVEMVNGSNDWTEELYARHGYAALRERFNAELHDVNIRYPVNFGILKHAEGVIVHSDHSRCLAEQWFGKGFARDWRTIPLLRTPSHKALRAESRVSLHLPEDAFVICSFGLLGRTKLNHRLLKAFLSSRLVEDKRCHLIFVGQNHGDEYGAAIERTLRDSGLGKRLTISGWVELPAFRRYLAAADLAVQLRTASRGETSAAVLDCMNYGLPTIVNAHGSMAELPQDAVWMLPDDFQDEELVAALETLWRNGEKRQSLSMRAQDTVLKHHAPEVCAKHYADAIESFHARAQPGLPTLINAIAALPDLPSDAECQKLAASIARSLPGRRMHRQLLLDISATCNTDLRTGIERVACALTLGMIASPPQGYRVETVYLCREGGEWHYRYARHYTLDLLGCPSDVLTDEIVEPSAGDILLGLDMSGHALIEAEAAGLFADYRRLGISVYFVVFDLLPIRMPQHFPPGAESYFRQWLQAVLRQDGVLCISRATAEDLHNWRECNVEQRQSPFRIGWFHQGADIENAAATRGLPVEAAEVLAALHARPSFVAVGTIEPRKGYLQTLDAFERLWSEGIDVNFVIVGAEGWKPVPQEHKRTIPKILERLQSHPERNGRLFWLEGISDEYLEKIYAAASCLIAASEGEGFGLPLIEAARHKLPILARDIPVFREVAGEHASYFRGMEPDHLFGAIREWLALFAQGRHPKSEGMPYLTWSESAARIKEILFRDDSLAGDGKVDARQLPQAALPQAALRFAGF